MQLQQTEALWYRISAILLAMLFFSSYLIPEWATALVNQLNFYSNAWDEANYLTHQMALTLRYSPSYWFGENIYLFLESFGMSGSWQNVLFDTLLTPTIVILTALILRKILNISMASAIIYALIIWFASMLLSYANPLIGNLFSHQFPDDKSFLVAAVYPFPSILRTPNPQFSYFLIVVFIGLYIRFKKWYLLLIPLLFLYFPIFVFYLYLVTTYIFYKYIIKNNAIIANFLSALLIFILLLFFSQLPITKEWLLFSTLTHNQAYLAASSHKFQLPLIFLIFLLPIPWLLINQKRFSNDLMFFYNSLLCSLLICANTQIVTGLLFAPKIFQSDSAVIIAGLLMMILLHNVKLIYKSHSWLIIQNIIIFSIILISLIGMLKIHNFSFNRMSFFIRKYSMFTELQLNVLKNSPFVFITGDNADFYAQNLPYAIAGLYAPLQSVHYTYLPIIKSCAENGFYLNKAINYIGKLDTQNNQKNLLSTLKYNAKQNFLVEKFSSSTNFKKGKNCRIDKTYEPSFYFISLPDKI